MTLCVGTAGAIFRKLVVDKGKILLYHTFMEEAFEAVTFPENYPYCWSSVTAFIRSKCFFRGEI